MEKWAKYIPWALFSVYFAKLTYLGANYADASALLIMASLILGNQYQSKSKEIELINEKIKELGASVDAHKSELAAVRSFVSSQQLGQMRLNKNVR